MTAADDLARAREFMGGALPMPLGSDRCYRPAPKPADADMPLTELQQLIAGQRADASVDAAAPAFPFPTPLEAS